MIYLLKLSTTLAEWDTKLKSLLGNSFDNPVFGTCVAFGLMFLAYIGISMFYKK